MRPAPLRLVPNWRSAPRMASMWCYAATVGVLVAWLLVPWQIEWRTVMLLLALQLLGMLCRLVAQPNLVEDVASLMTES